MQKNIKNRTVFCHDNLEVLQGFNSDCIDLIYLDPPFNKKKEFTAPIGSSAEGASFRDYFREENVKGEWIQTIKEDNRELYHFLTGIKIINSNKHYLYNYCYLVYMAIRLIEMKRILKDTGSIYLHCDSTMSHYIKLLMDVIFGEKNFKNEIVWNVGSVSGYKSQKKGWVRDNDIIYFYIKNNNNFVFNKMYQPYKKEYVEKMFKNYDKIKKQRYRERSNGKKYYEKESNMPYGCNWLDIYSLQTITRSKQYVRYPTQKPLALLERIIKASSNENDIVLDPFCGCATTCIAAEKLNRQWIGIDVSVKAYEFVKERLQKEIANPENLLQYQNKIHYSTTPPKRNDDNRKNNILKKYVYIISHPKHKDYYKIGIATDYKARINSYQTSDPLRQYKLEYKVHTPYFRKIEKHIHDKFDNLFEWVKADLRDIVKEIENFKM